MQSDAVKWVRIMQRVGKGERVSNVLAFPAKLHCEEVNGPWTSGTAAAPGSQIMQTTILIMFRKGAGQEFSVIAYCL